jgi:hypothetical protein
LSDDPVAGTPAALPAEPAPEGGPATSWPHRRFYDRVIDALYALPDSFRTSLNIAGVRVTDLYTLNSALGASIEQSVVDNLNALRPIWDPDNQYQLYGFIRQNQVFPDVLLQSAAPHTIPPILKGHRAERVVRSCAKEGEPSFRYTVSPGACADADLLVVFPWILDEVVSGRPRLMQPFVVEARYAATHRNHYWSSMRGVTGNAAAVIAAKQRQPYPRSSLNSNLMNSRVGLWRSGSAPTKNPSSDRCLGTAWCRGRQGPAIGHDRRRCFIWKLLSSGGRFLVGVRVIRNG